MGPQKMSHGFVALAISESKELKLCDGGKSDQCPDVEKAINTWNFALARLRWAAKGRVDQSTWDTLNQLVDESIRFQDGLHGDYRPSDADFPRIVYNNRLITS